MPKAEQEKCAELGEKYAKLVKEAEEKAEESVSKSGGSAWTSFARVSQSKLGFADDMQVDILQQRAQILKHRRNYRTLLCAPAFVTCV